MGGLSGRTRQPEHLQPLGARQTAPPAHLGRHSFRLFTRPPNPDCHQVGFALPRRGWMGTLQKLDRDGTVPWLDKPIRCGCCGCRHSIGRRSSPRSWPCSSAPSGAAARCGRLRARSPRRRHRAARAAVGQPRKRGARTSAARPTTTAIRVATAARAEPSSGASPSRRFRSSNGRSLRSDRCLPVSQWHGRIASAWPSRPSISAGGRRRWRAVLA